MVYFAKLSDQIKQVVTATRGNHGQSIAFSATRHNITSTIFVPHGNSTEKNAAMQALGATVIEHGDDFQEAREFATQYAHNHQAHMIPSFHPLCYKVLQLMHLNSSRMFLT